MTAISTWIAVHRKAVASLIAGVLGWGTIVQSTGVDSHAWWALATIVAGAFGVSGLTNDTPGDPAPPDAGQSSIDLLVKVMVVIVLGAFAYFLVTNLIVHSPR